MFFLVALIILGVWISYQDIFYGRIPNSSLILLTALLLFPITIGNIPFLPHLISGVIGISLVVSLLLLHKNRWVIGAGDLKLFCIACGFMEPESLSLFMIGAGLIGTGWATIYRFFFHKKTFPLGPSIMLSLFFTFFYKTFYSS